MKEYLPHHAGNFGCSVGMMPLGQLQPNEGKKMLAKNDQTRKGWDFIL